MNRKLRRTTTTPIEGGPVMCPSCKKEQLYLREDGKHCCDRCTKAYFWWQLGLEPPSYR